MINELTTKLPLVLQNFGIKGTVVKVTEGPLITDIEIELGKGSKFSYVEKSIKDIARELGVSGIRAAQIPNSTYISFEIPQPKPQSVPFATVLPTETFQNSSYALPICVGVNMHGEPVMKDLSKMPHLLVAGTTGSGKSVGLNSFILSLIEKKTPQELQIVLIDPKRIEFGMYNKQKYMLQPVITEMSEASACLQYLCDEMNHRYALFEKSMVRNIGEYIEKGHKLPYIVCVIDEFADLIMFDKNVEKYVQMLAQKSRASGIHLLIATQRPSVDVITGTIKANLPTRLSYKVSSPADSMTILNTAGAEDLLGRGDSLLLEENGTLTRILGVYVSNDDIMRTLEPYRCGDIAKKFCATTAPEDKTASAPQKTTPEKPKSWWSKLWNGWFSITKRNRTRIINGLVALFYLLVQGSRKTSARSTTVKKIASRAAKDVLTSANKKRRR